MLPDSARNSITFSFWASIRFSSTVGCLLAIVFAVNQLLVATNDRCAVLGIHLHHDASALRVFAGDERRSAPSERVIDHVTHIGTVQDEFAEERDRLHCGMERTARGLRHEPDRLVLPALEVV